MRLLRSLTPGTVTALQAPRSRSDSERTARRVWPRIINGSTTFANNLKRYDAAMKELLLVAFGGALGSVARWTLGGAILHHTVNWRFPLGTFTVNVVGCIVAGLIAGLIIKQDMFSASTRVFLLTGVMGGFTTFSAFGLESMYLARRGEFAIMALYISLSVIAAVGGLLLALRMIPGQAHHP